jgi:hypothetical protein
MDNRRQDMNADQCIIPKKAPRRAPTEQTLTIQRRARVGGSASVAPRNAPQANEVATRLRQSRDAPI